MPPTRHPTLEVLANPELRIFVASRFFSAVSMTLLRATIAWHVFELTQSAFYLGLIGIVQFAPVLPFSLIGGAVADSFDRRRIVMLMQGITLCGSGLLWFITSRGADNVAWIYAAVLLISIASAFENPARSAILPTLVPRERFPTAVTLYSAFQNIGWVAGPVLAGFIIDAYGLSATYALNIGALIFSIGFMALVHPKTVAEIGGVSVDAVKEGIRFVRSKPAVLASMVLDMFAVVFASATALLPIFASDVLHVGARGYGMLSAAMEMGTVLMALILLVMPPLMRPGRALLYAVAAYGIATIVFGLSRSFPLSIAAFMIAGMADQVSMVSRSTILQLSTPDRLRGRVNSVNMIFINASNQLGVAESGFLAAMTSPTFSVVFGGAACLCILAVIWKKAPPLVQYRVESAEA